MDFNEFIKPELLMIIPVLYLVGAAIKKSSVDSKHIPWILGVAGVVLATIYIFAAEPITGTQAIFTAVFTAITQGILCAGASVYVNQIYKQAKEG